MNANLTKQAMEDVLGLAVKNAVKERINELVEAEVKKAQDKIARLVPEIVAGIALRMESQLSFERMGTDIRILIRLDDKRST